MKGWSFISSHGAVMAAIAKNSKLTALEIAAAVGIQERRVRRIIADLIDEGYVRKTSVGRRNQYEVNEDIPLHRPMMSHIKVGELLRVLLPLVNTISVDHE